MNESELDDKIRCLTELQKLEYSEFLFNEVGGYEDYYDGLSFSEAQKNVFCHVWTEIKGLWFNPW